MFRKVPIRISHRVLLTINISLAIVAVLLVLNLNQISVPTVGQVSYALDPTEPVCILDWQGETAEIKDLQRCCLEARKQAECIIEPNTLSYGKTNWLCQTSPQDIRYWLNNKAYGFCTQQEFW